jgi:dUTP pyrophosphatase
MKVKIINKSGFPLPKYETEGAAAFDIRAVLPYDIKSCRYIKIAPGQQCNIDTGLYIQLPKGKALLIPGRSGNAFKHGISVTHGIGTIDSDYRGEIKICLTNHGKEPFEVKHGDRIAQGIIVDVYQAEWEEVEELDETSRGTGGFGSTGRE